MITLIVILLAILVLFKIGSMKVTFWGLTRFAAYMATFYAIFEIATMGT